MSSSLAAQLAQNASLNASLLVDRSRRKPTQSYLFTAREADQHDLDSIHALAVNAFFRLKTVEPALANYEDALFSDAAKATDRTLQNAEANDKLNESLNSFLPLLGPYLLESPTGKIIEWLVRRFRINEFNVDAVLALFFPYQESPHYTKMLSILRIPCVHLRSMIDRTLILLQGKLDFCRSPPIQVNLCAALAQGFGRPDGAANERRPRAICWRSASYGCKVYVRRGGTQRTHRLPCWNLAGLCQAERREEDRCIGGGHAGVGAPRGFGAFAGDIYVGGGKFEGGPHQRSHSAYPAALRHSQHSIVRLSFRATCSSPPLRIHALFHQKRCLSS